MSSRQRPSGLSVRRRPRAADAATPTTAAERLAHDLVGAIAGDPLADELAEWLARSRRFRAFADAHRDKIRKKLRSAGSDRASRLDVRAELRLACLLLADRRMEVVFEAYGVGRPGPDFSATFRGRSRLNLEITRLRRPPEHARDGGPIAAKLRQLPPSAANLLILAVAGPDAAALEVAMAMDALHARAAAGHDEFFTARGLDGARGFSQRCRRLGAVVTWAEGGSGHARAEAWVNPSARIPVPERLLDACVRALRAG